jgi:hypothetical protein
MISSGTVDSKNQVVMNHFHLRWGLSKVKGKTKKNPPYAIDILKSLATAGSVFELATDKKPRNWASGISKINNVNKNNAKEILPMATTRHSTFRIVHLYPANSKMVATNAINVQEFTYFVKPVSVRQIADSQIHFNDSLSRESRKPRQASAVNIRAGMSGFVLNARYTIMGEKREIIIA